MGRRPAAPDGAATARITVRLPEPMAAEWRLAAGAAGATVSDWVRARVGAAGQVEALVVGRRPPRQREGLGRAVAPAVDPAVVMQLARIGNNLNQIARSLNAQPGPLTIPGLVVLQTVARDLDVVLRVGLPRPRR